MADENEEQPQSQQKQAKIRMPEVRSVMSLEDDYVYESRPMPTKPFETESGQQRQAGGMAQQFETVASGLDNFV